MTTHTTRRRPTLFDRVARTIQERYVPLSNLPNRFYEVSAADPLNTDEVTFKLDHNLSSKDRLGFLFHWGEVLVLPPSDGPGGGLPVPYRPGDEPIDTVPSPLGRRESEPLVAVGDEVGPDLAVGREAHHHLGNA